MARAHGEARSRRRSRILVPVAAIALLTIAFADLVITIGNEPQAFSPDAPIEGLISYPDLSSEIINGPIAYDSVPPAGGPHAPVAQACGVYRMPVDDKHAVKSLATGAVWVAYQPDLPGDQVALLEEWFLGEDDVILAPYPGLSQPLVATAWGVQLPFASLADNRFAVFMERYVNGEQAPQSDENCAFGVGAPGS